MAGGGERINRLITLMTDFGLGDPFVGTMKGVIISINPEARMVDLTHDISSYNIRHGAVVLSSACRYFPEGTIFLVVVDPTVGSERNSILAEAGGHFFAGPDNGILWPVLEETPADRIIRLENRSYFLNNVSKTFHGRDIFAPVAAWLSTGTDCAAFGPPAENIVELSLPRATLSGNYMITGEVLYSDRFGNLATNITGDLLEQANRSSGKTNPRISVRKVRIEGINTHYAEGKQPSALVNSWGYLEIYLHMGNAREQLGIEAGDPVWVSFE